MPLGSRAVDVPTALGVIGVGADQTWAQVRTAYREALLDAHPDLNPTTGSAIQTDRIVAAYRCLRAATGNGTKPLPGVEPPATAASSIDDGQGMVVLHARPGRAFDHICVAAEALGQISYIDRHANLLQVTIDGAGWEPSLLTVELEETGPVTTAAFTLDSFNGRPGPPIDELVARLARTLREPQRLE